MPPQKSPTIKSPTSKRSPTKPRVPKLEVEDADTWDAFLRNAKKVWRIKELQRGIFPKRRGAPKKYLRQIVGAIDEVHMAGKIPEKTSRYRLIELVLAHLDKSTPQGSPIPNRDTISPYAQAWILANQGTWDDILDILDEMEWLDKKNLDEVFFEWFLERQDRKAAKKKR